MCFAVAFCRAFHFEHLVLRLLERLRESQHVLLDLLRDDDNAIIIAEDDVAGFHPDAAAVDRHVECVQPSRAKTPMRAAGIRAAIFESSPAHPRTCAPTAKLIPHAPRYDSTMTSPGRIACSALSNTLGSCLRRGRLE